MEFALKMRVDQFDVAARLKSLGLSVDILHDTIEAGYHSRSRCTDLDPPMFPGITMWATMVRRLRQRLLPESWSPCDNGNYSTILSPDSKIALVVATGDENTGHKGAIPTTQSSKGPRTMEAVRINTVQFALGLDFPEGYENPQSCVEAADTATWILLVHCDNLTVRAELSHPLDLDENQRVSGWRERIILPVIEFAPDDEFKFGPDEEPSIDIPVRRRVWVK